MGRPQREPGTPVAGLVLTGGASRRMGRDKASLVLGDGRTCARTVADRLVQVADPVLEVGRGASGLPTVADDLPAAGPLAALASGWAALARAGHAGPVLVLACDLPAVTVPLLRLLARAPGDGTVVPVVDGRAQPLCARFGAAALDRCRGLVDGGHRSMRALLDATSVTWLGQEAWSEVADAGCFDDVDTPDDLARWLEAAGRPGRREHHGGPPATSPPPPPMVQDGRP